MTGVVKIKAMLWESVTSLKPLCDATEKAICETHSGGTATCTDRAVCEACGLSYGDLIPHSYSADWIIDDTHHWYECGECHYKKDLENHIFDYVCDTDCNVCGHTRQASHVYDETGTCECGVVYTSQGLEYTLLENDTYELSGIGTCTDTAIFVPAMYEGKAVTSVKGAAFFGNKNITSIYLPDCITSIGESAFAYCSKIKAINIPTSLTAINNGVFQYCYGLENITIPSNITSIGESAFKNCSGLKTVVIPGSVTSIGKSAFNGCTSLRELVIPEGVTKIEESIVRDCTLLRSITIPKSVTEFARYSFDINHITIKYNGTKAEWEAITKDRDWNVIRSDRINCCHNIVCTDQTITGFSLTWASTESGHTYTCSQCNTTSEQLSHYYSSDCDEACDDCGYSRTTATLHSYSDAWSRDDTHHWHECSVCGDKKDYAPHNLLDCGGCSVCEAGHGVATCGVHCICQQGNHAPAGCGLEGHYGCDGNRHGMPICGNPQHYVCDGGAIHGIALCGNPQHYECDGLDHSRARCYNHEHYCCDGKNHEICHTCQNYQCDGNNHDFDNCLMAMCEFCYSNKNDGRDHSPCVQCGMGKCVDIPHCDHSGGGWI